MAPTPAAYSADRTVESPDLSAIYQPVAGDFAAGIAHVDPLERKTCQQCHLHNLCRVFGRRDLSDVEP